MITVTTPIGSGTLVGRLRQAGKPEKMLVTYRAAVIERAVALGFETFLPYCGGPTVLYAWDKERVTL